VQRVPAPAAPERRVSPKTLRPTFAQFAHGIIPILRPLPVSTGLIIFSTMRRIYVAMSRRFRVEAEVLLVTLLVSRTVSTSCF